MGSPWPAPAPDEQIGDGRGPNYALRRAVVLAVVVALVGLGAAWFIGRGGNDSSGGDGTGNQWNTIVLQNSKSGELTLSDAEGKELDSYPTSMIGLLDVGLPGRLVVGIAGHASTDGLGVLDLDDGKITDLTVPGDNISRLDDSAYLLAAGDPKDHLGLVDVSAGEVVDLHDLADAVSPNIDPALVRIDPERSHIAFTWTELPALETVLVDLVTHESVSLAGSLVDIASGAVLTITDRGPTSLFDLSGFDGKRIGTVETDAAVGGLLLDGTSALVVTRAGKLVSVDFDDEKVEELGSVAEQLTGDSSASGETTASADTTADEPAAALVRTVVPVLDRSRLIVLGKAGVVIVNVDGTVVASDRVADAPVPANISSADRCVVLGAVDGEQTLWDTSDGRRIETFDSGFVTGRSADGCTVTYTEAPTGGSGDEPDQTRLVGRDVDRSVAGQLGAVAPDGSSAIGHNDEGAFVIDAGSGDLVDLPVDTLFAVFTDR